MNKIPERSDINKLSDNTVELFQRLLVEFGLTPSHFTYDEKKKIYRLLLDLQNNASDELERLDQNVLFYALIKFGETILLNHCDENLNHIPIQIHKAYNYDSLDDAGLLIYALKFRQENADIIGSEYPIHLLFRELKFKRENRKGLRRWLELTSRVA